MIRLPRVASLAALLFTITGCGGTSGHPLAYSNVWTDGKVISGSTVPGGRAAFLAFETTAPEITEGVVHWTSGPIIGPENQLVAARVDSLDPVTVTVVPANDVDSTALVEIVGEAYWQKIKGTKGPGTPEFDQWIEDTNALIAQLRAEDPRN